MSRNIPILISIFFSGASLMAVEVAGARIMAPFLGTTIFTWAASITAVLLSLSLGYFYGGKLADCYPNPNLLAAIFLAAGFFTIAIPFLAGLLLPFTTPLDIISASILASIILIPASLFYGMVSPFAIKLTSKTGKEGSGTGNIFAVSTAGSIAGTLATGFVLVPATGLSSIFLLASFSMAVFSMVLWRFCR